MQEVLKKEEISFADFLMENPKITFGFVLILCVIVLVVVFVFLRSKLKNQEKVLRIAKVEEERYRILAEISNDILFEYDIFSDEMFNFFGDC